MTPADELRLLRANLSHLSVYLNDQRRKYAELSEAARPGSLYSGMQAAYIDALLKLDIARISMEVVEFDAQKDNG